MFCHENLLCYTDNVEYIILIRTHILYLHSRYSRSINIEDTIQVAVIKYYTRCADTTPSNQIIDSIVDTVNNIKCAHF